MSPAQPIARHGLRARPGTLFIAAIALTVLAYGSASTVQSNFSAIAFAVLAVFAAWRPIGALGASRLQAVTILLLACLLGYAALQALPLTGADLANAAWKSVNENIRPDSGPISVAPGTISVAPGMTLDALSSLAPPFLAFISALAFFQGDDEAVQLWRALAYFGAAYAAFGILQDVFLPDQLLLEPKKYYVGYLTATFVNRNTAGTFFGLALVLNLGLEFHELRKVRIASFVKKALNFDMDWRDRHAQVLIHGLLCLIIAVALFLTQSRGAVGATFVACVVAAALMTTRPLTADKPNEDFAKWRRYAAFAGSAVAIVGLFALFAERSVYRMQEQGSEDGRWCAFASTIAAIKDNWISGTGFGAFQDVFPAYRDAGCAGIYGVWERAHNFFLEGWLGLGLPFVAAAAVGYSILIGVFVRGARNRHELRFVPVMGLAALILASLHSIVDFSLQIPGVGVYFAAVMAAAATVSMGRRAE